MRAERRAKEKAIQEMSAFTERTIITRKCSSALVGVLKEVSCNAFTELEIDTVISRLLHAFQTRDPYLKVLSYAFIRNIADLSSGSFVAINALINNITARKDGLRAEALKLLLQITPEQMLEDCSKYVHQALIETEYSTLNTIVPVLVFLNNPSLSEWFSSCAWMKGLKTSGALGNAVLFMHRVRPQESREVISVLGSLPLHGITAVHCARYLSNYLANPRAQKIFTQFLVLDETDPAPFIEALRHIHLLPNAIGHLDAPVKGLRRLLQSNSTVVKVSALRTIDALATRYKQKMAPLREVVEEMLTGSSTVALLAMAILLKVGSEKTAGKIAESLPKLLSDIGETQKISIIESVTGMCDRFKGTSWDELLKKALNAPGSCDYKIKIVQNIAKIRSGTEDKGLKRSLEQILCSYIEDSSYPRVTIEIIGILIDVKSPEYTISLMNRTILDNENVLPAVNLALSVSDETIPMHALFGAECNEDILKAPTELNKRVIDLLQEDAEMFVQKREETQLEAKFNSMQLQASDRIELNRTESEFGISVVKNIFTDFVVLQYTIASKIDLVLEEGRLRVFLFDECICDEVVYLRGRESTSVDVKIPVEDYRRLCGAEIVNTFGYSVYDNRDYEVGEVRLNNCEITVSDFIAPGASQEIDCEPLVREYKFNMPKEEVAKELKNIFKMDVEESESGLEWSGVFVYTGDPVHIKASVKEKGSIVRAEIKVFSKSEDVKNLLIDLIN
ncbi:coatomer subunit gamma [Nematocida major]|uniref:coatomer subunit gamma n=1 Tax=Nematocida major TaxID=1912982 RepID=UPI002008AC26|nr:coatomer subunit gamma [Nematocida major]KAH9386093.1 coatomer subunit gamma [Nematocida major]